MSTSSESPSRQTEGDHPRLQQVLFATGTLIGVVGTVYSALLLWEALAIVTEMEDGSAQVWGPSPGVPELVDNPLSAPVVFGAALLSSLLVRNCMSSISDPRLVRLGRLASWGAGLGALGFVLVIVYGFYSLASGT